MVFGFCWLFCWFLGYVFWGVDDFLVIIDKLRFDGGREGFVLICFVVIFDKYCVFLYLVVMWLLLNGFSIWLVMFLLVCLF